MTQAQLSSVFGSRVARGPWLAVLLLVLLMLGACTTQRSGAVNEAARTESDQTDVDRRVAMRLELAYGYFSRGQYSTALDELKLALQARPQQREALNLRGLVYSAMGESVLAEASFKQALSLAAQDPDTLHNYGLFLCRQQRWVEARQQFELAVAQPRYRTPSRTWLARGICEATIGNLPESERSLMRAFELEPANPAISFNLAEVLFRAGQPERARFYIRRVNAQAEQSNAQTLWLGLRIERRMGNSASVDDLAQQLRRRYPQSNELRSLDEGRYDE